MNEICKAQTFGELIEKFNPYHDRLGRFTTADGATSFTLRTQSKLWQNANNKAIEREKQRQAEAAAAAGPGNKKLSLDQAAIRRADDNSLMGSAGTVRAKEAQQRVDAFKEEFKEQDGWTDEQKTYVKQRQDEYTDLVSEYYNDQIRRTGENVSWAVAGPANYNYARHDKKLNAQMNRANEYEEKMQKFRDNTRKKLESMTPEDQQIARWRNGKWKHGETIDAADPLAEKKLQAKIDYLTEYNEKSKAANKYWNKNHDMTGFDGFSEATNQKLNTQFQRIYQGQIANRGLESVRNPFSTNSAEIRSTKARLDQIKQNKATASTSSGGSTSFKGGSMIRNAEANRLQLKFDGVPDAAVRQQLKSSGWRWSPKNGVWQRQLTDNAEYSAKRIIESINQG